MNLYCCENTNEIIEEPYSGIEMGFCIVEKYEYAYQKELLRFKEIDFKSFGIPPYGLPYEDIPRKRYLGIGNPYSVEEDYGDMEDPLPQSEDEVIEIRDLFYSNEYCDIVWFRIHDSNAVVPHGYRFCGYDITYVPEINGAFSIINDCLFICKWHGCDENGTAFSEHFELLNENGLFDDANTALGYMKHYLSFDWSERGEYCICEIYRNN